MKSNFNRRRFIKKSAQAGLGIAFGNIAINSVAEPILPELSFYPFKPPKLDKVRIGMVGVGGMGTSHVSNFLKIKGCEIIAVCDIIEDRVVRTQNMAVAAGFPKPEGYSKGELDFKRMCQRDDIDLVFTATPWEWHVPVCLEAMNTGKHAATEVPAAYTIEDCWKLIETSEKSGRHCIMMENCNYDREEMIILNLVKKGILGEILHARCGYLHDLRAVKHDMNGEGVWRRAHSMKRNGDLYPTHGLGPVSQCLDINRGNYFDYLVSFGTKTKGLHKFALDQFASDSLLTNEEFILNDVVSTLIRTMNGETILVTHDTSNPRPYSRDILVQGTNGIVQKYPTPLIHIEGRSPEHTWEELEVYKDEFYHPLWKQMEQDAVGAGHGGMDFLEDYRLIHALLNGLEPDMDVYDAAVLSAVTELSEKSIAGTGKPMQFPDFTRGLWKTHRTLKVMEI
jgi:predicted dehydrogenase